MPMKQNEFKFEEGKSYLVEFSHKAFGGGMWTTACTQVIGDRVCLSGKWHDANLYLESRTILSEVELKKTEKKK